MAPSNALEVIKYELTTKENVGRFTMALGFPAGDEKGKAEAFRYSASVFAEVEKSQGDDKKDLTVCTPQSIVTAAIDAARFKFMVDGRQLCHLVKYGNKATLQIGFRGYLFKIKEAYPDADFTVEAIYKGDVLKIWDENGLQHYSWTKVSPFRDGDKDFEGILFAVTYTDNGRLIRKVSAVAKSRIDRARKAAKTDYIWNTDYIEKAKAAAIKAASKVLFASIQGLQEAIRYDNEQNFNVERAADTVAGGIIDNLNTTLKPTPTPAADKTEEKKPSDGAKPGPAIPDAEFTEVNADDEKGDPEPEVEKPKKPRKPRAKKEDAPTTSPDAEAVPPPAQSTTNATPQKATSQPISNAAPAVPLIVKLAKGDPIGFKTFEEFHNWIRDSVSKFKSADQFDAFMTRNADNFAIYRDLGDEWFLQIDNILKKRKEDFHVKN